MIMHVITNYMANAGAETMLSRLVRASPEGALIVSLIDISERNRLLSGDSVYFERLKMHSPAGAATGVFHLARLISREKPSAILCWMYHAFIAGLLAQRLSLHSTPLFWNVRQSLDDPAALSRSTRAALRICRHLSHMPTGIIYNSSRSLELHRRLGFENSNVEVIPNGFDHVEERPQVRLTPHVFGIAARFHPQKDYETFFRAAALFLKQRSNVRFVAVGAGLSRDNVEVRNMMAAAGLPEAARHLRPTPRFVGRFDFIRAANILNLSYFPAARIREAISNIRSYCRGPGALMLVARSRGSHHDGTLFELEPEGTFAVRARVGNGSEVEALVLGHGRKLS